MTCGLPTCSFPICIERREVYMHKVSKPEETRLSEEIEMTEAVYFLNCFLVKFGKYTPTSSFYFLYCLGGIDQYTIPSTSILLKPT